MKFSIIIPVYNVEKYIDKCLRSVMQQSYGCFEAIVVNDGSPDNSQDIIDKYVSKDNRFISVPKKNGGLSDARNFGLQYVSGDYIIFLDSDDYLEMGLLEALYNEIQLHNKVDIIRYRIRTVDEDGNVINTINSAYFSGIQMEEAVSRILQYDLIEPAWIYAYRSDFFIGNQFLYPVGRLHEDFGLTPYILLKANKISSINYIGLNYVQRYGSIMNSSSREKDMKKAMDVIESFKDLIYAIDHLEIETDIKNKMKAFLARVTLDKISIVENKEDFETLVSKAETLNIVNCLMANNIKQKVKRWIAKFSLMLYMKVFIKSKER